MNHKNKTCLFFLLVFLVSCVTSQTSTEISKTMQSETTLPFAQIPEAPNDYTAENVAARMIEGLGFRFYWATEGLGEEQMSYRPSEDTRTIEETIGHIYGLSGMIIRALTDAYPSPPKDVGVSWQDQRKYTLLRLKEASDILRNAQAGNIQNYKIVFKRGEKTTTFPYWNMINGPIADALWHSGQVVMMRRAAGNPIPTGVNVFIGKRSE